MAGKKYMGKEEKMEEDDGSDREGGGKKPDTQLVMHCTISILS